MRDIEELTSTYYDRFMVDISITIQRYKDQLIDSFMFSNLAETYLNRYVGQLDALNDLDLISYEEWRSLYTFATDHVMDWESRIRKNDLEPSDPEK